MLIRLILRAVVRTRDAGTAPLTLTVRRLWERFDVRVDKCGCASSVRTTQAVWQKHVEQFTRPRTCVSTDEWQGYQTVNRRHASVAHGEHEWARDDDGDGIREVHANTTEGMWTGTRNFLRPFRGVHKRYLGQYVAMCEFSINLKRVTPKFISSLVAKHSF